VLVRLLSSPAEAERFAGSEALDTAVVGNAVAVYPDQAGRGARAAAEGCMGRGASEPPGGGAEAPAGDGAPAERQRCDDVTITPNSGDGLFEVTVRGTSCEQARGALLEWGRNGYPNPGPPGLECGPIERYPEGNVRLRCSGQGQAIEFDTGV
jgi:hypothetical protein